MPAIADEKWMDLPVINRVSEKELTDWLAQFLFLMGIAKCFSHHPAGFLMQLCSFSPLSPSSFSSPLSTTSDIKMSESQNLVLTSVSQSPES